MIVLSYLGILSLIPYFAKKDDPDPEIHWHAKNGLGLFIAELIVWAVFFVAQPGAAQLVPRLRYRPRRSASCGWPSSCISIICIVKGIGGQRYRIPVHHRFRREVALRTPMSNVPDGSYSTAASASLRPDRRDRAAMSWSIPPIRRRIRSWSWS